MTDSTRAATTSPTDTVSTHPSWWRRIFALYVDGFRSMRTGRKLWALIIVKLLIIFGVLKLFFFPDVLKRDYSTDTDRAAAVRTHLLTTTKTDSIYE